MENFYTSAYQIIGKTPLLELTRIESEFGLKTRIFAKLEYFNPAGSIKDRIAKAIIEDAEKNGKLKEGSVIIEPTSGNTGIGLASVVAAKGYETTGPEIWNDTDGRADILVAGIGTGGTITGAGRYLKEKNPNIKIVAVEPSLSPILSKGTSGAALSAAIGVAGCKENEGKTLVVVFPDSGDRYYSTSLFEED